MVMITLIIIILIINFKYFYYVISHILIEEELKIISCILVT
jgi:hypothetical protein